jgi:hypothetical protein
MLHMPPAHLIQPGEDHLHDILIESAWDSLQGETVRKRDWQQQMGWLILQSRLVDGVADWP